MTDKEKLDAIRAEIHRLVDVRGYDREMANDLFAFIDSLPNEPVSSIWHDASEKSDNPEDVVIINPSDNTGAVLTKCTGVNQGHIWAYTSDLLKLDNSCKIGKNLQEEPVSEDLEKTIDTFLATYFSSEKEKQEWPFLKKMAIHFAEWQKQKDSELPKIWHRDTIDEYAYQIAYDLSNDWKKETATWDDVERACKLGSEWQKQQDEHLIWQLSSANYEKGIEEGKKQMMKDAFEREVKVDAGGYPYIPQMELYDYDKDIPLAKEGDKYKVILIKED